MKTFKQFITEKTRRQVLVPPRSIAAGRKFMGDNPPDGIKPDDMIDMNIKGKNIKIKYKDSMSPQFMDDTIVPHETIHAMQDVHMPELFQGLPDIDLADKFSDSTDEQFKKYFSRPPEIMAHAYDAAVYYKQHKEFNLNEDEHDPEMSDKASNGFYPLYKNIGGDVFEQYMDYVKQYLEKI